LRRRGGPATPAPDQKIKLATGSVSADATCLFQRVCDTRHSLAGISSDARKLARSSERCSGKQSLRIRQPYDCPLFADGLDGHVTRQQQPNCRIRADCRERERRIACTEDQVRAELAIQLLAKGRPQVDCRQDSKPFLLQHVLDPAYGVVKSERELNLEAEI